MALLTCHSAMPQASPTSKDRAPWSALANGCPEFTLHPGSVPETVKISKLPRFKLHKLNKWLLAGGLLL